MSGLARLLNLIGIGRVTLVDDTDEVQLLQVTEGATGKGGNARVTDKVKRVTEFGFSSSPPLKSEVILLRRNADRGLSIAIGTSHRPSRPTGLEAGDVYLYDVRGRMVKLTADGIVIDGAGGPVTITNAAKVHCDCDIETTGDVISRAGGTKVSLNALHDAYNQHKHPPVAGGGAWGSGPPVPLAGGGSG